MRFTPKSESELGGQADPWPDGIYGFEVSEAEQMVSKNGNEMIHLVLFVYNGNGVRRTVHDYLLEAMLYKLQHAAEACGLDYTSGELNPRDFIGKSGRLKLAIEPESNGYPAKNRVKDYVTGAPGLFKSPPKPVTAKDIGDEIPF